MTDQSICAPIPTHLLSGFLGSGKTTLLAHLLEQCGRKGVRAAVVMNELGEVNLDGGILGGGVPMREVLDGCVCCSVRDSLSDTLAELAEDVRPDIIFVETTGVANPVELLDAATDFEILERVRIQSVTTVVDGPRFLELTRWLGTTGRTAKLMRAQIKYANLLVLNKTDLLAPGDLADLERTLREANPHARIVATSFSRVDLALLERLEAQVIGREEQSAIGPKLGHGRLGDDGGVSNVRRGLDGDTEVGRGLDVDTEVGRSLDGDTEVGRVRDDVRESPHERRHHHSHDHLMVYTHRLERSVDRIKFERLLRCLPAEVLRAKGIVRFADTPGRVLFQYAYREPMFVRVNPLFPVPDVAVFIGERLPKEQLRSMLENM